MVLFMVIFSMKVGFVFVFLCALCIWLCRMSIDDIAYGPLIFFMACWWRIWCLILRWSAWGSEGDWWPLLYCVCWAFISSDEWRDTSEGDTLCALSFNFYFSLSLWCFFFFFFLVDFVSVSVCRLWAGMEKSRICAWWDILVSFFICYSRFLLYIWVPTFFSVLVLRFTSTLKIHENFGPSCG